MLAVLTFVIEVFADYFLISSAIYLSDNSKMDYIVPTRCKFLASICNLFPELHVSVLHRLWVEFGWLYFNCSQKSTSFHWKFFQAVYHLNCHGCVLMCLWTLSFLTINAGAISCKYLPSVGSCIFRWQIIGFENLSSDPPS